MRECMRWSTFHQLQLAPKANNDTLTGKNLLPQDHPKATEWSGEDYQGQSILIQALTVKVPKKHCSRRHFNFLLLSFKENKAWFFMWILCLAEDSLETSSLIFPEKQWKKYLWMLSAAVVIGALGVNFSSNRLVLTFYSYAHKPTGYGLWYSIRFQYTRVITIIFIMKYFIW